MRFSTANAREMAAKSAEARRNRAANPIEAIPATPQTTLANDSPYARKLSHAQDCLLDELLNAESAKDKAALAQALKNLRETYHLATGLAKPGVRKPERTSTRQQSSAPSGPELPPDTTSGSGSAGQ